MQLAHVVIKLLVVDHVNDPAVLDQVVAVGDGRGEIEVLLDQQHGETTLLQLANYGPDLLHDYRRQTLRRLVQEQERRASAQDARDRQHLLLAAGQPRALRASALVQVGIDALKSPADPEWATKTDGKVDFLKKVMPNHNPGGAGGAKAPQEIVPTGGLTHDDVVRKFNESRAEIRAFVAALDQPAKEHIVVHPFPVFGALNAYDWLIYVPLHTIRHSRQIVEVQQTAGYPASSAVARR